MSRMIKRPGARDFARAAGFSIVECSITKTTIRLRSRWRALALILVAMIAPARVSATGLVPLDIPYALDGANYASPIWRFCTKTVDDAGPNKAKKATCSALLTEGGTLSAQQIAEVLDNKLIADLSPESPPPTSAWYSTVDSSSAPSGAPPSAAATAAPATGATSLEERLVAGTTDFLVDRAKKESALYLQTQLSDEFCKEGRTFFPKTCAVFDEIVTAPYSMAAISTLLRASIRTDLINYPDLRLGQLFDAGGSTKCADAKYLYARLALALVREARRGRAISEIVGGLPNLKTPPEDFCPSALADMLARATDDNARRRAREELAARLDTVTQKIRLASKAYWYLHQNLHALEVDLGTEYQKQSARARRIAVIGAVVAFCRDEKTACANLPSKRITERLLDVVDLVEAAQRVTQQARQLQLQSSTKRTEADALGARVRATLIALDALTQITETLRAEAERKALADVRAAGGLVQAYLEEDYTRLVIEARTIGAIPDKVDSGEASKYVPLMLELAAANTSDDVQKTLATAADPVGSYREKFRSPHLLSLTAFAGAARTRESAPADGTYSATSTQPFLPIGFHATAKWKEYGAIGVFASIVDLGTLAMSRQQSGTVDTNSNVGLSQVFAPGLYVTWNIRLKGEWDRTPFVVGVGAARTPKLVTTSNGQEVASTRAQFFVAIDMTLFAFR